MKVLFRGKRASLKPLGVALLCIALSLPAFAQEDSASHKWSYGLHAGFTLNTVDLYSTLSGTAQALEEGNHTIVVPGFRIATISELRLGGGFSLRAMPGVSVFSGKWEPTGMMLPASLQSDSYKMERVCGELPVDVRLRAIRWGDLEPYLVAGLSYKFDFASLQHDDDNESIQPLNAHGLDFSFGYGLDWYTRYFKVGFEFKVTKGLLAPGNGGGDPFYFHNRSSFSLGLIIEA